MSEPNEVAENEVAEIEALYHEVFERCRALDRSPNDPPSLS